MKSVTHVVLGSVLATAIAVIGCGSSSSKFGPNDDPSDTGAPDPFADASDPPVSLFDAGPDAAKTPGEFDTCATATAKPARFPVKLVIMFDKSTSMILFNKWDACKNGFNAFFADPASKGISASLSFFPQGSQCGVSAYATPTVAVRPLPDGPTFGAALGGQFPNGDTPTLPALQGAIQYAKSLGTAEKVAVVLVTDGEPNICSSTIQAVANEAQVASGTGLLTFVVGVGNVSNLNAIAQAGGTTQATIVSTNNPSQTAADLEKALDAISGTLLGCDYAIPPPPQNKTFEPGKVNVVVTPPKSSPQSLTYDPTCAGGVGWHYDDPKNPTRILLCAGTCDAVQKAKGTSVDVVLGCKTKGPEVN